MGFSRSSGTPFLLAAALFLAADGHRVDFTSDDVGKLTAGDAGISTAEGTENLTTGDAEEDVDESGGDRCARKVEGAVKREAEKGCKCKSWGQEVYCYLKKVAPRKFDLKKVMSNMKCAEPYCASEPDPRREFIINVGKTKKPVDKDRIIDVKYMFKLNGGDVFERYGKEFKCCRSEKPGEQAILQDITTEPLPSKSWIGSKTGCGRMFGSGWHSFKNKMFDGSCYISIGAWERATQSSWSDDP